MGEVMTSVMHELLIPEAAFRPGVRALDRCDRLGAPPFSETEGQLVRRFLTPAHRAALDALTLWMTEAGMTVRLDEAANLIGRYEGDGDAAPTLMIGSHIDTVRNAGRYDGALGVMLAIDCVDALSKAGRRFSFAIEVIAFGDEEGSRFPIAMTCSAAVAGGADPAWLTMRDADGVSLAQAYADFGALERKDAGLSPAEAKPRTILAFLEAHIEQGPVLEAQGLALGVVSAIAAQKRFNVRLSGSAGHAGTTPMTLRRDPGPAAAEAILAIEEICRLGPEGLVGTVGRITAMPGSFNVIPGAVEFSMDVRAQTCAARDRVANQIIARIEAIGARRAIGVAVSQVQDLPDSPCDVDLTDLLEDAVRSVGVAPMRLFSGAAHDAMVMARVCPTAMLFLRCKGGVSHNPLEAVSYEDCAVAAEAMLAFIDRFALTSQAVQRSGSRTTKSPQAL